MASTDWFTDSLMGSAAIDGTRAIRLANASVRSASSSSGNTESPSARARDLWERFAERFRTRTRDEWTALLEDSEVCAAPVLSLAEAGADRQMSARGSLVTVDGVLQSNVVPRFSRFTPPLPQSPPVPGTDTERALREGGIDDAAGRRGLADD